MSLSGEHHLEAALLIRLMRHGRVQESQQWHDLIRRIETAGWIAPSSRKDEWLVADDGRISLETRLQTIWPSWILESAHLKQLGLDPCKPRDLAHLPALQRPTLLVYSELVNERNWNASTGIRSKLPTRLARVNVEKGEPTLTQDAITRLRPNPGLRLMIDSHDIDLHEQASRFGECVIPQRAWRRTKGFFGELPGAVLTCENLGAYVDLPLPKCTMAIFSPGYHVEPALEVLRRLPKTTPWWHFGDLDPEGIAIARLLATASERPMRLFIPSFASDYLARAQPPKGAWGEIPDHPILSALRKLQSGIEQEMFMLDARLEKELERCIGE